MSTVETVSPRTIRARSITKDLSGEELRALARSGEKTTEYGSPVYATRIKNRSAKKTYVVADGVKVGVMQQAIERAKAAEKIREVQEALSKMDLIQVDRRMGMSPEVADPLPPLRAEGVCADRVHVEQHALPVRLLEGAGLHLGLRAGLAGDADLPRRQPGLHVHPRHRLPRRGQEVDAPAGDVLDQAPRAGSASTRARRSSASSGRTASSATSASSSSASPGTGKTTLTLHDHGLKEPERAIIKQDDVVLLTRDGRAFGTEDGFYIKTEGLEPSQTVLWGAATHPTAAYENIAVGENGKVDFLDTSITSNGRGVVLRRYIQGTSDGIDLTKANKIVFITRRNDVVPVCARLSSEQAAAYFMLGESIETSAGDPTKAGQAKREVGTNPFIVGPEAEEGNRILQILRENPDMQAYILNTGSIGAKAGSAGDKITIKVSTEIMKQIAKEGIRWEKDPDWGYDVPTEVPGVDLAKYDPRRHYSSRGVRGARRQAARRAAGVAGEVPGSRRVIPKAIESQ